MKRQTTLQIVFTAVAYGGGNFGAAFYGLPPAPPPPPMQDGVPMAFAWAMPVSAATTAHNSMNAVELT